MAANPPDADPAPPDGALPAGALEGLGARGFGAYVHVPFCASRCGYCDFNTYTPAELGAADQRADYVDAVVAEIALAARVLGDRAPELDTVFFGGGTPTMLAADQLARILSTLDATFGLAADAEVTTEANPESVDAGRLRALRDGGINRLSLGMQSAREHVLALLDRRHTPGRAVAVAAEARAAGFERVSLDLIYGTPGESADDWAASLAAVVESGVDHVSAYALIVEDGTRLGRQVARGELPAPDDDVLADKYLQADAALTRAGLRWYEVSNWSRPGAECRHNQLYWRSGDWWGFGPGAHSHVGGVRWWNAKHPATYGRKLAAGESPGQGRETLDGAARAMEDVMLRLRLADGLELTDGQRRAAAGALDGGLLDPAQHEAGRAVLTLRGRLLADAVVRELTA